MKQLHFSKKLVVTLIIVAFHGVFPLHVSAADTGATATFPGDSTSSSNETNVTQKKLPRPHQFVGIVGKVDLSERSIVISGNKHFYGIDIKVHSKDSGTTSVSALSKSTLIGFSATKDAAKRRILQEIWILPKLTLNIMPTPSDM